MDISPEAIQKLCSNLRHPPSIYTQRTGKSVHVFPTERDKQHAALFEALRRSLTAGEKLLREVHITGDLEWLYAETTEADWISRRDAFLAKGDQK